MGLLSLSRTIGWILPTAGFVLAILVPNFATASDRPPTLVGDPPSATSPSPVDQPPSTKRRGCETPNARSAGLTGTECGNASYDSGVSDDADWFGGGLAGDPNYMFAVRFDLADFGYLPGDVEIVSFCAANQVDFGGQWPNEVFIYLDADGVPDDSVILGRGTIRTGDGSGPSEVVLMTPVTLDGDFWLVNRGDPSWAGEDFNMEFDDKPNTGHSFTSSTGVSGLTLTDLGNYALRATLQAATGACSYAISQTATSVDHEESTGSVKVFTQALCGWSAVSSEPWISITTEATSTGSGTVGYVVSENTGPKRTGQLTIAGHAFSITQSAPPPPADFSISVREPEIGEFVTFSADPILGVVSWDFGGPNCWEGDQNVVCSMLDPGTCDSIEWAYVTAGEKDVTMVLADGRSMTKSVVVRNSGECCTATGPPLAAFTMSTEQAMTGETVVFAGTTDKAAGVLALAAVDFSWTPISPAAGETTFFQISGVDGDIEARWEFGGAACGKFDNPFVCSPLFTDCHAAAFAYATPGSKTVTLTVKQDGVTVGTATHTIIVSNLGYCDDGLCRYTLTPTSATFPAEGGTGEFEVDTAPFCEWAASTNSEWLEVSPEGGVGASKVSYSVAANRWTAPRLGAIEVEDWTLRVSQEASPGDTKPTAWRWTIVLDEAVIYSGTGEELQYIFHRPGIYSVTLEASNCIGSDSTTKTIEVLASPVNRSVIPAAVDLPGANDTLWVSDFRFFNPCGEPLEVRFGFEPEGTNNTDAEIMSGVFQLGADETVIFQNIREAIPGLEEEKISGSARIESSSTSGCNVISVSRTFNETPSGTQGLFVPALPVTSSNRGALALIGLTHDQDFRTNVRLVNFDDEDATVHLVVVDANGNPINDGWEALVPGHSTRQINAVTNWTGVYDRISLFSVRVTVPRPGPVVEAFATVVDNHTGDSVLHLPSFPMESKIWLVGVAHLTGVNDSRWRTDLSVFNPTSKDLLYDCHYTEGRFPEDPHHLGSVTLAPNEVRRYLDIAGSAMGEKETRGYVVLNGIDGATPQIAARTYNLDITGGTSGLNLRPFGSADLLQADETGYIAGVSTSKNLDSGFRTNLGILNTDENEWTGARITLYGLDGSVAGGPLDLLVPPGELRQFEVFRRLGINDETMTGTIKVEVLVGGAAAVYATEIDNQTQDPIFIPAQKAVFGSASQ